MSTRNSKESTAPRYAPERRTFATAAPTWGCGSAGRWVTCTFLFGNAAEIASPVGLSVRWPWATAHFITALMYRLTGPAVSVFVVQIGSSTAMTSVSVTASTGLSPSRGNT